MTQVKRAHQSSGQLAHYSRTDHRSLASRRAAFAAQMRAMALSDLKAVAGRLRSLKAEYERLEARKIADYDLAPEIGVKYRTYQSWVAAEVENRDGKGYDKVARFYSKKLGRKITRHWILFGDEPPVSVDPPAEPPEPTLAGLAEAVESLQQQIQDLAATQTELAASQAEGKATSEDSQSTSKRGARRSKPPRK